MKQWVQGYACAVATIVRTAGANTEHREALEAAGITEMTDLHRSGVDEYDIEVLKPIIKEIQERRRREPSSDGSEE